MPGVVGSTPRCGQRFRHHPSGVGLLRRVLRLSVSVRQVRPDLCPRVQPRRHGEPGTGDLHRGIRVPRLRNRRAASAPRQHDPARNGAHVVRRSRDHGLVGRLVAQGILRRLHGIAGQRRSYSLHRCLGSICHQAKSVGVPPRSAADHASYRRRHRRSRSCEAELRRNHLRQGRQCPQATRGVRRR